MVLFVNGLTSGFGGSFKAFHPSWKIIPAAFFIYESPGNCGINPNACPEDMPTKGAFRFKGKFREISIHFRSGSESIIVLSSTEVSTDLEDADGLRTFADGRDPIPYLASLDRGDPNALLNSTPILPIGVFFRRGWSAWANLMPGSPHSLHVVGQLMMTRPGYAVELTESVPQGTTPSILILTLKVTPPVKEEKEEKEELTPALVSFAKPWPPAYSSVMIICHETGKLVDALDISIIQ